MDHSKKVIETYLLDLYVGNVPQNWWFFRSSLLRVNSDWEGPTLLRPPGHSKKIIKVSWIREEESFLSIKKTTSEALPFLKELFCMRIVHVNLMCTKIFDIFSMFFPKYVYTQNTIKSLDRKVGLINIHFRPGEPTRPSSLILPGPCPIFLQHHK